MFYLSQSIEIPKRDVLKGKVTLTKTLTGESFDWSDVTGDLLTIRSSERGAAAVHGSHILQELLVLY